MLYTVSKYLDIAGPLLALTYFLISSGRLINGSIYLVFFLCAQLLTNVLSKILMHLEITNIRVYQANALIGYITITGWFLYLNRTNKKLYRGIQIFDFSALLLLLLIIFTEETSFLNNQSYTFVSLCICGYGMLFFLNEFKKSEPEAPNDRNYFILNSAILGYYLINFFIFLGYGLFTKQAKDNFQFLWSLHNVTLFVSCFLLALFAKQKAT
ncbi:MAG: hypothetical protein JNM68_07710 [Dinghuibacter sp.]|nr:hypothetical protein [Dinghuibacter sp.]